MRRRQTLPRLWLITDPRGGDPVAALKRMPHSSGVVLRHFELAVDERRRLYDDVRAETRRRRGIVLVAEPPRAGRAWFALDPESGLLAHIVHNRRELVEAQRSGADLIFVSPVFVTRSHPGARALGVARLGLLLSGNRIPAYALGGLTAAQSKRLQGLPIAGWAAIDGLAV